MKNDWINSDYALSWRMNQPFWIASGGYNGGLTQLTLYLSPGRVRFPYMTDVVASGQPRPFAISNPAAARYYTIFMRSAGTIEVSGSTGATIPGPIHRDAEYLGQVYTGASLSGPNLQGPWNQSTNFNTYEQRGEMAAQTAALQRLYFNDDPARGSCSLTCSNFPEAIASSGLNWIHVTEPADVGGVLFSRSLVYASIEWVASGALSGPGYLLPSGLARVAPAWKIRASVEGLILAATYDTRTFFEPQDPDRNPQVITAVLIGQTIAANDASNFVLTAEFRLAATSGGGTSDGMKVRIRAIRFGVIPGFVISSASDKRNEPA